MGNVSDLEERATELVREAFDIAAQMQGVDLAALNEARPAKLRYGSKSDLVRDFTSQATAMLEFAVKLGLITVEEDGAIMREVATRHPELWAE
jgi:hypothetical protein